MRSRDGKPRSRAAATTTSTGTSRSFALTLAGRFVAGVAAGLAWAVLAGIARRMVPSQLQGKAIAVAMAGVPVALSLGVPLGTFVGDALGWRIAFGAMSVLAIGLVGWIAATVPDQPGQPAAERAPVLGALAVPGVAAVLFVTLTYVLAHTILYAYIATYLDDIGLGGSTDAVLLVFGTASLVSIWLVGAQVDQRLRALTLASAMLVAVAAALLVAGGAGLVVYVAAATA